jgi:hypothetical protein
MLRDHQCQIIQKGGGEEKVTTRKGGKTVLGIFEEKDIISTYSLTQAIADGVLVELFKNRWGQLSGGKPIVATEHLFDKMSLAGLLEIWNEFVEWKHTVEPTLQEEDRLFTTSMNFETVWVIEDGQAYTLMYPEDY